MPELLWAALFLNRFGRDTALEVFRTLGDRVAKVPAAFDIRHTAIATCLPESKEVTIDFLCRPQEGKDALRPLLLIPHLPAREAWSNAIQSDPLDDDWRYIASAVADVLHHQSQAATDLRWLSVLCRVAAGKLHMPPHRVNELALYPHLGDQRSVRPSIRATEISLSVDTTGEGFPREFWNCCLEATECFPLSERIEQADHVVGTTVTQFERVRTHLIAHCGSTRTSSGVDGRHDTVFGMSLFALALVGELIRIGASTTIGGRFTLRTLLELYVTLAFLVTKDAPELWSSYRVFGSGQAKLALLKLEEMDEQPYSISMETLQSLANEDMWQEFLSIDIGHWTRSNLRKLSEDAGVKEDYDRFYSWTSMYSHGHWAALRASVFDTCGNPLHRLHRIPRSTPRTQRDVLSDAVILVDKLLSLVDRAYPNFAARLATR